MTLLVSNGTFIRMLIILCCEHILRAGSRTKINTFAVLWVFYFVIPSNQ